MADRRGIRQTNSLPGPGLGPRFANVGARRVRPGRGGVRSASRRTAATTRRVRYAFLANPVPRDPVTRHQVLPLNPIRRLGRADPFTIGAKVSVPFGEPIRIRYEIPAPKI